ncbi:MAG: hypothetical protein FWG64_03335 [Firmicutes bacterium]|nr:hypothetical protein [Bacillota bacterium]
MKNSPSKLSSLTTVSILCVLAILVVIFLATYKHHTAPIRFTTDCCAYGQFFFRNANVLVVHRDSTKPTTTITTAHSQWEIWKLPFIDYVSYIQFRIAQLVQNNDVPKNQALTF